MGSEGTARGRAEGHTGRDLLLLAGLVLLTTLPGMFNRDLWNPDEPRYTEVAREMVVGGDYTHYVVPHLDGYVYPDKPPLFFWLAAGFWKLGAGYNSGRLVTMLAVFGTLALVYLAARKSLGRGGALLAAGAGLTTFLLSYLARRGVIDPLLVFFTTAALLAGFQALQPSTRRRGLWWLACYAALGLGTLEKGPVAILVPALVLLVFGLLERRRVKGGGWFHLAGLGVLLVLTLPWVIAACLSAGPEYTHMILVKEQTGQAVDSFSHKEPFYYYFWNGPVALIPWIFVLPLGIIAAIRQRRSGDAPLAFFATVWLIVTFVFFSCISIKRMNYMLPLVPAIGILMAWYFGTEGVRQGKMLKAERVLMAIALGLVVAAGVAMAVGAVAAVPLLRNAKLTGRLGLSADDLAFLRACFSPVRVVIAVVLALPTIVLGIKGLRTPAEAGLRRAALLTAAVLLLFLPLDVVGNRAENVFKSGRRFAQEIRQHAAEAKAVYLYGNNFSGVYNLYSGIVSMPVIEDGDKLLAALATPGTLVVADGKQIEKLFSRDELERHLVYEEGVGHRHMVLLKGLAPGRPAAQGPWFEPQPRALKRLQRLAMGAGQAGPLIQPGA